MPVTATHYFALAAFCLLCSGLTVFRNRFWARPRFMAFVRLHFAFNDALFGMVQWAARKRPRKGLLEAIGDGDVCPPGYASIVRWTGAEGYAPIEQYGRYLWLVSSAAVCVMGVLVVAARA